MTWYQFDWSDFVTDGLLSRLAAAAGAGGDPSALRATLQEPLSAYFRLAGGLPVSATDYGTSARTRIATRLIHEGALGLLSSVRRRATPGTVAEAGDPPVFRSAERIAFNRATRDELDSLPGVGPALAERIVEERRDGGPFAGPLDLATRVSGIGPEAASAIAAQSSWAPPFPTTSITVTGDSEADLALLIGLYRSPDPLDRLARALDALAQYAASNPHPDRLQPRLARLAGMPSETPIDCTDVTMLAGSRYYYRLPSMIAAAGQRVLVCMFHIALPEPSHPTRTLLDALIAAKGRGLDVRVLMDADRPTDPYRSTVINEAAAAHLSSQGVDVRFDPADRLLHSKYLIFDSDRIAIGSHNWSAGSYFQHDDLTLVLTSAAAVAEQGARFEALWSEGTSAPPM